MYKITFFLAILLLGTYHDVRSENDSLKWSPEFSMSLAVPTQTSISPDGKLVAYAVREALTDGEQSSYLTHIWVASIDGMVNVQFTRGDKSCTSPQFSPDGKYIGFLSSREGKTQVYRISVTGGEAEKLTDTKDGVNSFKWSPDGKRIAFIMKDPESEDEKKMKDEKRDIIRVDKDFKYNHIYVQKIPENNKEVAEPKQVTAGQFSVNDINWSPDGKNIAFSFQPEPGINTGFIHSDISIVPSDSGDITSLVERPGLDTNPFYSPDGKTIAFESQGGQPEAVGLSDIWTVSANGGKPRKLAESPNRECSIVSWSVDGKYVYVNENLGISSHLLAIPMKGEDISVLSFGNYVLKKNEKGSIRGSVGVWSSFGVSSKVQAMSFIYQEPEIPPQVYYSNIYPYKKVVISKLNENIQIPEMAKTEVIKWRSGDGLEIEGLVTWPLGYEPGRKYPVILNVHGGPGGVFQNRFTGGAAIYLIQYFAEKGYIVLRPNPRGSTGYGKDFRYANVRDWGYGDYEDLISGLDHLIGRGVIDENRQYLMGWSYGGYMTSYMVTKTDRFKAASMGAGLPNLVSMVTTTDIPEYLVAHMGGKEFWQDYETYEKHSAIYRIGNVKTPTQVIHGQQDLRVPFTQGQEFYVALKRAGVPAEMIVLPRTPHGPREPKLQMAVSPLILDWFEKYR